MKIYKETETLIIVKKKGNVWQSTDKNKLYLERCPKCEAENYAMMVSSGVCCWCGYKATIEDVNNYEGIKK